MAENTSTKLKRKINMQTLSVTQYAKTLGLTRQGVLLQIKEKRLAKGVSAKKIGNTYVIFVKES